MPTTLSKPRNAVAKDLRTPKYRTRVVRSARDWRRNAKHRRQDVE